MVKVFIDGSAGTTGLRIHDRLLKRDDVFLITLDESQRKDQSARKTAIENADIVFLCLPDEAAKESVMLAQNTNAVIIDASTAHRVNPDWTYGLLEIGDDIYSSVRTSKRICVPGCHASGFIALVKPLLENNILTNDYPFSCTSLTGYSGGGKSMINAYQDIFRNASLSVPNIYALTQTHKHLKEMKQYSGTSQYPVFSPIITDVYSMMCVTVNISLKGTNKDINDIRNIYINKYKNRPLIITSDIEALEYEGFIPCDSWKNKDSMKICVTGNNERVSLIALYDNLGKGASGAAIQIFNTITGCEETKGLQV